HAIEGYVPAQRVDFHVAVLHVGESDGTVQRLHVHMRVVNVTQVDGSAGAFHGDVAAKFLRAQRSGSGVQGQVGVHRDQNFVIDAAGLGVCAGQQVRLDLYAIANHVVVHF